MKHLRVGLFVLFVFCFHSIKAQQNHFIYIQTENKQAFYVKLKKKIYSSSAAGYLVIPKLKDGAYSLAIGFPKSAWAEQNLLCTINSNDVGYLLKNFDDKGWGLFNLQTLSITMADDNGSQAKNVAVTNKTDAFSTMLSSVVNDSTIRQTETVKETVKEVPVAVDSVQNQAVAELPKSEPSKVVEKAVATTEAETLVNEGRSVITRSLLTKNADGTEMVFIDETIGQKDTVRVFIPVDKATMPVAEEKPKEIEKPKEEQKAAEVTSQSVKLEVTVNTSPSTQVKTPDPNSKPEETNPVENKAVENEAIENKAIENKDALKTETASVPQIVTEPVVERTPMINSDCKSLATDEDFLKLRKKMAAEDNDDDMIGQAKKSFKTKCFTVDQVKNLSVLFLKDAGKYAFFDVAYPRVSDSHNFSILQSQLSDTYYINRFQSMIRH
jgi:hypothetical protein